MGRDGVPDRPFAPTPPYRGLRPSLWGSGLTLGGPRRALAPCRENLGVPHTPLLPHPPLEGSPTDPSGFPADPPQGPLLTLGGFPQALGGPPPALGGAQWPLRMAQGAGGAISKLGRAWATTNFLNPRAMEPLRHHIPATSSRLEPLQSSKPQTRKAYDAETRKPEGPMIQKPESAEYPGGGPSKAKAQTTISERLQIQRD